MAKPKPLPPMNPANAGRNPPFVPPVFATAPPPKGTYQEAGIYQMLYDYVYNGQTQTAVINFKWPKPV